MATDQVELLTLERGVIQGPPSRDIQSIIDSLPVKEPTRKPMETILDSVAQDTEDPAPPGEGPAFRAFLTGLNGAMYVLAIAAALFLTWAAGVGIVKYLGHY